MTKHYQLALLSVLYSTLLDLNQLHSILHYSTLLDSSLFYSALPNQCNFQNILTFEPLKVNDFKYLINHFNKKKISFDIIVHNVGGGIGIKDNHSSIEDWKKVWDFNVGIAIKLNNEFLPRMKKRKWRQFGEGTDKRRSRG